jgi:undecaprenyl diphosphate synthase
MNDELNIPNHIAIIMDGNGRWAETKNKPRNFGHEKGAKVAEKVIEWSATMGVKYLTLYSFSTENWKRPKSEVNFLFKLFVKYLESRMERLLKQGLRMRFTGDILNLPDDVQKACYNIEKKSENNSGMQTILALNYGGRQEIVDSVNKLIAAGTTKITQEDIFQNLYLNDVPDPDFILRTSGEYRLSNFLLWQSAYSELYFTDVLWPNFSKIEFLKALKDYSKRKRRFGGLEKESKKND